MTEEFHQKILISAESKLGPARAELLKLNQTLDEQLTKQKLLELQGKRNTEEYISIASQVRLTKQAIRDSNRELDNASKAFNSASNSIQQNRALLSTLTAEYIKLSQVEGKTSASTLKLKGEIEALTGILKNQEKQMGQTNRNVGNYAADIQSAISQITGSIPGFQQFGGAAQGVAKVVGGFLPQAFAKASGAVNNLLGGSEGRNVISGFFSPLKQSAGTATVEVEKTAESLATVAPAAGEAEAGLGAVGAGAGIASAAIGVLTGVIAGAVYYMSTLGSVGLKSAQVFDGVKAAFLTFADDIAKGKTKDLASDLKAAYNNAVELKKGLQDIDFKEQASDITLATIDRQIEKNMLMLRNKKITLEEAKKIDKETGELDARADKLEQGNIRKEYELVAQKSIVSKKLSDIEKERVLSVLQSADIAKIQIEEKNNNIEKGTSKTLHDLALKYNESLKDSDLLDQKRLNRQAIIEQRFGRAAAKLAEDQIKEIALGQANLRQAEQDRLQSLARQYEFTLSAYGKELAATDAHYADLLFKEQQFVAQNEKLAKLAKTPKSKGIFLEAAAKGKDAISQLNNEWNAALQKVYTDNDKAVHDLVVKSQDELKQAAITNIQNDEQRQIESLKLQAEIRNEAHQKEKSDRALEIQQLRDQAAKATADEATSLNSRANQLQAIQANADKRAIEEAQTTADAIRKVKQKADEDLIAWQDQQNIDAAKPQSKEYYSALKQQVLDQAQKEISDTTETPGPGGIVKDTSGIRNKAAQKLLEIDKQAALEKKQFELEMATQTSEALFSITKNSIQRNEQARLDSLNRQKELDLRNTSLTATQKLAIEDRYQREEAKEKVSAFKAEQKASILQAVINGALAITKATAQTGVLAPFVIPGIIAETAIQVATIAAQKAPTYATGGLHYVSDSTGSLLRGPGTGTSDSINARLSNGESVINAKSTAMFAPLLSAINQAGGGRAFNISSPTYAPWVSPAFATGGLYNSYIPTSDNGLRPSQVGQNSGPMRLHQDDIAAIGYHIGSNFPNVLVDVKDISYQQGIKAQVQDRVTYPRK